MAHENGVDIAEVAESGRDRRGDGATGVVTKWGTGQLVESVGWQPASMESVKHGTCTVWRKMGSGASGWMDFILNWAVIDKYREMLIDLVNERTGEF